MELFKYIVKFIYRIRWYKEAGYRPKLVKSKNIYDV